MIFLVKELRKTVQQLITERTAAAKEHNDHHARMAEVERENWVALNRDHWLNFADAIVNLLDQDEPITFENVPVGIRDSWGRASFYTDRMPVKRQKADVDELLGLQEVLKACVGETISSTALRDMGFRNLANLFRTTAKEAVA